ncbi:DUF3298 domain-containing protein, partial [bacterium]|nr:DUF3298 domain-containing protein [bacterium]
TGERMSQNNIFASDQAYAQALGPLITAWQHKNDVESDIFGTGPYTGSRSDDIQFYLAEDGVHFVFNEYDIAPYAYGPVDLVVPYSQTLISL